MRLPHTADRTGLVLGNRYRLLALVGSGASASVYLADDRVLGRRVAVKILHEALADDERFLRRFRDEARAAAALNHPHVMAVYDWGEEPLAALAGRRNIPFLVTEYLGGGSLRAVLATDTKLTPAQALQVGLEAVRGLEYAHRHGLVHRDIKPANLLFDEDARLRIADFGLARALAEAHWSEPAGALAGTAKYASPEQARGEPLDGRSDVYSLALVLVEAVTGEVPFLKDTTLGTLMARLDQPLPVDDSLGELAEPLRRAGAANPAERYDATELRVALAELAETFEAPEHLELPGAELPPTVMLDEAGDDITTAMPRPFTEGFDPSEEHTEEVAVGGPPTPASRGRLPGIRKIAGSGDRPSLPPPPLADAPADQTAVQPLPTSAATGVLPPPAAPWGSSAPPLPGKRSSGFFGGPDSMRWAAIVAVAALIAGGILGGAYWYANVRVPTFPMPVLKGRTVDQVEAQIAGTGWQVQKVERYQDGTDEGDIIAQYPDPYVEVARGGQISIEVSKGPTLVPVPTLPGKSLTEARDLLEEKSLRAKVIEERYHEEAPAGTVLSYGPGVPDQLPKGREVPIVVSKGPEPRVIPGDLVGKPWDEANATLTNLQLKVQRGPDQFHESVPGGAVMSVDPAPGATVERGATVTVVVSKGKSLKVPPLLGTPVPEAIAKLQSMGLKPEVQGTLPVTVRGMNPPPGTEVQPGTTVILGAGL